LIIKKVTIQHYYLLLGGNQGDRVNALQEASKKIEKGIGPIANTSLIYQTEAWGKTDQSDFLNQALVVESTLPASNVLSIIQAIESELGRQRNVKWGERTIDIDILYIDNLVIDSPNLVVPHPEIQNRRFALIPLVELNPTFVHPLLKKTNRALLDVCSDALSVTPFTN